MTTVRRHFSDTSIKRLNSRHPNVEECTSGSSAEHPATRLRDQLAVEYQLQGLCQRLLDSYKDQRDWVAVGQVAHSLVTSSQRISVLKEQLLNGDYAFFPRRLLSISEHPFENPLAGRKAGQEEAEEEASDTETDESGGVFDEEASKAPPGCFDSGAPARPGGGADSLVGPSQQTSSEGNGAKAADTALPPTLPSLGDSLGKGAESSQEAPPGPNSNTPPLDNPPSGSEGVSQEAGTNLATEQSPKKLPEGEEEDPPSSCDTDLSSSMSEAGGRVGLQLDTSATLAEDGGVMEVVDECVEEGDSEECAVGEDVETTMADADIGEIANGVEEDEVCSNGSNGGDGEVCGEGCGGQSSVVSEKAGQNGSLNGLHNGPHLSIDLPNGSDHDGLYSTSSAVSWSVGDGEDEQVKAERGTDRSSSLTLPSRTMSLSGSDSALHLKYHEDPHGDKRLMFNHSPELCQDKSASSDQLEASGIAIGGDSMKRQGSVPAFLSKRTKGLRKTTKKLAKRVSSMSIKKRRRRQADPTASLDPTVKTLSPIPGQEWDPTCLLEELYADYRRLAHQSMSGESSRFCGYLQKLPVDQTKKNILKGYKRRYFRAIDGNLYYHEDLKSDRALGFIRLENCKITMVPEKLQLHVTESGGKVLVVRALNHVDLTEWHRALQLESLHPTTIINAPSTSEETPVIIVDVGACSVRAGLGGDEAYPEMFFPSVCSIDSTTEEFIDCGLGALLPENRFGAKLIYPRRNTVQMARNSTTNNQAIVDIITTVLSHLNLQSYQCILLMTVPPAIPEPERAELAEAVLGNVFQFQGILFQEQAILSLYSYNVTTGIVVDIGDHIDIVPVIDGYPVEAAINRLPFGGNAITEYLTKLITSRGIRYFSQTETYINRFIKEAACFVSLNYAEDCTKCETQPALFSHQINVDRFQLPDHRKAIVLNEARFKAPEGLFNPNLWGKDVPGLHELVWKSVQACSIDDRKLLLRNIYLSGGTSLLLGLKERLKAELTTLAPAGTVVEVHTREHRQHAAYLGASVLSRLTSFHQSVITPDDWNSKGPECLKKWSS